MMNFEPISSAPEYVKIQSTIQAISRTNFYLWMFAAQEGFYEEALEFVTERQQTPSPFETMLGITPYDITMNRDSPLDDF